MIKKWIFFYFNLFFIRHYYKFCAKKIQSLPKGTQIFFMTRRDFGTYIQLLHYIACWQEVRGATAIVVLTGRFKIIESLTRLISPQTILIGPDDKLTLRALKYFGERRIHLESFAKVYGWLVIDYPEALYLFNQASSYPPPSQGSFYNTYLDPLLKQRASTPFCKAYVDCRSIIDYRADVYADMLALTQAKSDFTAIRARVSPLVDKLKQDLGVQDPYVVMNINCKDYTQQDPTANRKKIEAPQRYNALIDFLITKGFHVVLQGRAEQPQFPSRPGFTDYARSSLATVENDVALFAGAAFAIVTKTGPENFATLCGTPLLGLNYVELTVMTPHTKMRFFPKNIRKKGELLSPIKVFQEPSFFDLGKHNFDPEVVYEDLEEEDLLKAVTEFLDLLQMNTWEKLTPLQEEFKQKLSPLHLDQYLIKGVPCDTYLRRSHVTHM